MVGSSLAVICARGGSKRIPKKNIIDFFGKPLIAWTIEAALQSNVFDKVIVSTDDPAIASIAEKFGADVPFLRQEYADDNSPLSLAVVSAVEKLKNEKGELFDTVTQLMPNCPLRDATDIINSMQSFKNSSAASQISCFEFGWMNPWWAFKIKPDSTPESLFPEAMTSRSQDLEKLYCPTGAIWISSNEALLKTKTFYSSGYSVFPLSWTSAVDIDTLEDLEMAKAIYLLRNSTTNSE